MGDTIRINLPSPLALAFCSAVLLGSFSSFGFGNQNKIYIPTEVKLSPYKSRYLATNSTILPLTATTGPKTISTATSSGQVELWILSQGSLWRWDLKANTLRKINPHGDLPSGNPPSGVDLSGTQPPGLKLSASPQAIVRSGSDLYFVLGDDFFYYKNPENKLFQVAFPQKHLGLVKDILLEENTEAAKDPYNSPKAAWVLTNKGLIKVDLLQRTFTSLVQTHLPPYRGRAIIGPKGQLLLAVKNKILAWPLSDLDPNSRKDPVKSLSKAKLFFQTTQPILGVHRHQNEVYVHTAFSMIRLDFSGKPLQSVPAEQRRSLHSVSFEGNRHGYLFQDGLVEIYDTGLKKLDRYVLPAPKSLSTEFLVAWPFLILNDVGTIRVFDTTRTSELNADS